MQALKSIHMAKVPYKINIIIQAIHMAKSNSKNDSKSTNDAKRQLIQYPPCTTKPKKNNLTKISSNY